VAAAIFALITAIRLAAILICVLITAFEALARAALAALSFALNSFFSSGAAVANHFLSSAAFFAASSEAFKAFLT